MDILHGSSPLLAPGHFNIADCVSATAPSGRPPLGTTYGLHHPPSLRLWAEHCDGSW